MMVATVKAQIVTSPRNDCPHSGVRPLAGRRGVNEGRGTELSPEAVHQEHTGIQRITQVPVRTVGDQFAGGQSLRAGKQALTMVCDKVSSLPE
jgi:hypothetical protein